MDNKEIAIKFGAWIAKQTEIFDGKHFAFKKKIESTNGNVHNDDLMNVETLFEIFLSWEEITISNEQSEKWTENFNENISKGVTKDGSFEKGNEQSEIERLKEENQGLRLHNEHAIAQRNSAYATIKQMEEENWRLEEKVEFDKMAYENKIKQLESKVEDQSKEITHLLDVRLQLESKLADYKSALMKFYTPDMPEDMLRLLDKAEQKQSEGQDEMWEDIYNYLEYENEIKFNELKSKFKLTRI